jgi:glyoxylase-like metal-dependent hydrolase (beta-lactamase superfamily II)
MPSEAPVGGNHARRIDRRAVLAGGAAAAGCGMLGAAAGASAQSKSTSVATGHAFRIGEAEITVFSDGAMPAPLDVVLADRTRAEIGAVLEGAGRAIPAGDVMSLAVNITLVRLGKELILIDAGSGPDFAPLRGKLPDNLARAGIKPEAITKVVFTHAHPDHFWGMINPLDGGSLFPKARHFMSAVERDHWLTPGIETRMPEGVRGSAIGTQRRLKELGDRIELFKPGAEIVPGIATVATPGHTPGHVSLVVSAGAQSIMIGGDALIEPAISFARPEWRWGPDWDADAAVATRKRLLDMLASARMPLVGYHLPWPGLGRVERSAPAFRFVQDRA